MLVVLAGQNLYAAVSRADDIRLAYLVNFARYTTWPPTTSVEISNASEFTLCVKGAPDLYERLEKATFNKQIENRRIKAVLLDVNDTTTACDLLFITGVNAPKSSFVDTLSKSSTLLIGNVDGDERCGDSHFDICFMIIGGTVRFEVNLSRLRSRGFSLSAQLLRHAEQVNSEKNAEVVR